MVGMPRSRIEVDRLVRPRAVADQVAQAVDGVRLLGVDGGQHRLRGGAIAVQVAEDGDAGGHSGFSPLRTQL